MNPSLSKLSISISENVSQSYCSIKFICFIKFLCVDPRFGFLGLHTIKKSNAQIRPHRAEKHLGWIGVGGWCLYSGNYVGVGWLVVCNQDTAFAMASW